MSNIDELIRLAESGDLESQDELSRRYFMGDGVAKDINQSIHWCSKAAGQGNVVSMYNLGLIYASIEDYQNAARCYSAAADHGHSDAQNNLGGMYRNGRGVPKDIDRAIHLYLLAIEQGNLSACFNLAQLYYLGPRIDYEKAFFYYSKAAEQGHVASQYNLSVMYRKGVFVHKDMALSFKWCLAAAESGDADAQYNVALMYDMGDGVQKNLQQAIRWYTEAARQGDPRGHFRVGVKYEKGAGVQVDLGTAK